MAAKLGPKIVNDGLVLCLDAADANSYAGEPTTNLLGSNDNPLNGMSNITFTKVETQSDGWIKYSMSGTFTGGTYPYICYIDNVSFTGGTAYTSRAMIKTNVENKFNYFGTSGISYVNQPKDAEGTSRSVVTEENGLNVYTVSKEGFIYTSTTSQRGYLYTNPVNNTTFSSSTDFVWIKNVQVEQKTYPTPYVYTSRSATDGWVDLSGNSNSGTLTNMVGTGASHYRDGQVIMPINNAYLDFDGNDDKITIVNSSSYNNSSSKTVEVWIKADTGVAGLLNVIYSNRLSSDNDVNFSLYLDDRKVVRSWNPSGNDEMVILYQIGNGSTSFEAFSKEKLGTTTGDNLWHCVVGVTDTVSSKILLYYDGEYVHEKAFTGTPNIPSSNLRLGSGYGSTDTTYPFSGQYGTFRIYNKALTAAEVLSNYNATKGRFS